ncbi:nuclear receptor coactivator 5-like [Acanthaster planci]|uniref:Nuclear receptor coactivator 5-like n=1 Tax=Acanthaster planci TaxID=133434 RepID=A0A8B7XV78_ACAPL|nr:nuclear receptor coactivator 5-like [Acanthaster planci]
MRDNDLPPNARLHVAPLNENVNKENLKAKFAKHGTIYELFVHTTKGFGFVQYGSSTDAAQAIEAENQAVFEGKNIAVTLANKDRFGKAINVDDGGRQSNSRGQDLYLDRERELGRYRERDLPTLRDLLPRGRERSPLRDRYDDHYYDRYDRGRDLYERDREDVRRRDLFYEDRLPLRDRYDDRYLPEDEYRREAAFRDRERDRSRDRDRDRRDPLDRGRLPRDILDRDSLPRDARDAYDRRAPPRPEPSIVDTIGASAAPPSLPSTDKPIDCEILLMGKHLRDYADLVERRIKALSLNTGLLLISNEGSLTQALEDVTRRKVLYAIILTTQNEVHRSVTLNILHGSPQEHRNMPLEDALALVDRNFSAYLQDRGLPTKSSSGSAPASALAPLPGEPPLPKSQPPAPPTPQPPAPAPAALAVPAVELTIPQLINLLADRKQLTLSEMDRVIAHLQAVRRKMAIEQGLNPDLPTSPASSSANAVTSNTQQPAVSTAAAPVDKKQAELQAKILSIFNPSGSSSATASVTTSKTSTATVTAPQPVSKPDVAVPFSYGGSLLSVKKTQASAVASTSKGATDIDLDSPDVQKVLDKLIQSGPTMLKKLGTSANGTAPVSTLSGTQASNKGIKDPKSQVSGIAPKPLSLSKEETEAKLRAAQQAALQTLQQQETAARTMQVQTGPQQQNQAPTTALQNQYQQAMVQYPQQAQFQQQQQAIFQQQQQNLYQQQQQPPQQQMVQYPLQQYQQQQAMLQQPGMPGASNKSKPLLPDPFPSKGSGWPRGWQPPGLQPASAQSTSSQQGFQASVQPTVQQNPYMNPGPNMSPHVPYPQQNQPQNQHQQQNSTHYPLNRSQPNPSGML